ncbi:hypothetical protein B0H19DRAFT_1187808 [Mycena capillaripes]|nr:hypothetical protein B0H19DRAFT_1187808 [Mycena capillaripes]
MPVPCHRPAALSLVSYTTSCIIQLPHHCHHPPLTFRVGVTCARVTLRIHRIGRVVM